MKQKREAERPIELNFLEKNPRVRGERIFTISGNFVKILGAGLMAPMVVDGASGKRAAGSRVKWRYRDILRAYLR